MLASSILSASETSQPQASPFFMNIFEMHARKVPGFVFTPRAVAETRMQDGRPLQGFFCLPDTSPQIIIQNIFSHRPLRSFPPDCGWYAFAPEGEGTLTITLRDQAQRYVIGQHSLALGPVPALIVIPWPAPAAHALPDMDLELHTDLGSTPVFIGISRTLERKTLSSLCKGKGIEIGPGITPQIHPSASVEVLYAEEKGREDWLQTYAYKRDKYDTDVDSLPWEHYRTAPAIHLPAENNSLDFIFSSHLLEHVVNPIAHLEHWLSKLKPGGIIAGIMPHADYSVDYNLTPSMLVTMAMEYQRKETKPTLQHYRTIFGKDAETRMAEGRTLHVHFYNERNLQELLAFAAAQLPMAHSRIIWERNYKEFFFIIGKR